MHLEKYRAAVEHKVSMGNYENVTLVAEAWVVADEYEDPNKVSAYAQQIVEDSIQGQLERALEVTGEPESYVDLWLNGLPEPEPEPPRRRTRPSRK